MPESFTCPLCGKPCHPIPCDAGIGPYEFWGAKYNDSRPYMGSDCCEAELEDAPFPDDIDERADWEYERRKDRRLEIDNG